MDTIKYRALLAAVESGNLTLAAKKLGYTQPGISHMISGLEKEMGFPLLIRHKDGVTLTDDARPLLLYIRQIVSGEDKLHEAADEVNRLVTGTVRIGSFYSLAVHWLPTIIQTFTAQYPGIQVQIFEGYHNELNEWLSDGKIDVALTSLPAPVGFETLMLCEDEMVVLAPEDSALSALEVIPDREVADFPFIYPYEETGADADLMHALHGIQPNIRYHVKGDEAIVSMVSKGLGMTILPRLLLKTLPPNVIRRPLAEPWKRMLVIAVQSRKYASPAVSRFLDTTLALKDRLIADE